MNPKKLIGNIAPYLLLSFLFILALIIVNKRLINSRSEDYSTQNFQNEVLASLNSKLNEFLLEDTYLPSLQGNVFYCYIGTFNCGSCIEKNIFDFIALKDLVNIKYLGLVGNFNDSTLLSTYALKYSLEHVYQAENILLEKITPLQWDIMYFYLDSCNYVRDCYLPIYNNTVNEEYFKKIIQKRGLNMNLNKSSE